MNRAEIMKTQITKTRTGYNTCEIAERSIHKELSKDNIKINTVEIIEGFAVYFSDLIEGEKFIIETDGIKFVSQEQKSLFDKYLTELFKQHEQKRQTSLDRFSKSEFLIQLPQTEIDNLIKVNNHISYFIEPEQQDRFLKHCNDFINWLDNLPETKGELGTPLKQGACPSK